MTKDQGIGKQGNPWRQTEYQEHDSETKGSAVQCNTNKTLQRKNENTIYYTVYRKALTRQ